MNYVSHLITNYENLKLQDNSTFWMLRYIKEGHKSQLEGINTDVKEMSNIFMKKNIKLQHPIPTSCLKQQSLYAPNSYPKSLNLKKLINSQKNSTNPNFNIDKLKLDYFLQKDSTKAFSVLFDVNSLWYLYNNKTHTSFRSLNSLYNNINMHFLRKERLYTKLKYSRTPSYDIVSGGAAAFFGAFIGFLILEKVGFELVDSGDFWYLVMYVGILVIALKALVNTIVYDIFLTSNILSIFSPKHIFNFFFNFIYILVRLFK